MKSLLSLSLLLLAASLASAQGPATGTAPAAPANSNTHAAKSAPAPAATNGADNTAKTETKAPANAEPQATPPPSAPASADSAKPTLKFEYYFDALSNAIPMSDIEKKTLESFYLADATPLKNILNNDALTPFAQDEQVNQIRDARNAKIFEFLINPDRRRTFMQIEGQYRVALTLLAADGGWVLPEPAPAKK